MKRIFVNLKRFEVPRSMGGVCDAAEPALWVRAVMRESVECGLGMRPETPLVYFLPEALLIPAIEELASFPKRETEHIAVGCQGVHEVDISAGG